MIISISSKFFTFEIDPNIYIYIYKSIPMLLHSLARTEPCISLKFLLSFFLFLFSLASLVSSISRCFYWWRKKKKKTKEKKKERAQDKLIYPLFNPNVEVNSSEGRRAKRDNVGATRQEDSRFLSTEKLFSSLRLPFSLLRAHGKREREREVSGGATIIT